MEGVEVFSEAAKGEVAVEFFTNLFRSSNPAPFTDWFNGMQPRVSCMMNEDITRPVSRLEIKEAAFSINPQKALGPDGMTGLFFKKFWGVIEGQVVREVQRFFEEGRLPKDWNYTHLCLIPKIPYPEVISDLRSISLCSVAYKIVSKILVSRLQPWLHDLVSPTQSAFVSERLLSDNITIAQELVHSLGDSKGDAAEYMVVKTDMSKAYDRVEWGYLRSLLLALGFDLKWVKWVMKCVSTVTYSVLINDQPHGMITPQRGLRQGDPLSHFLFVLCTEGLIHLMSKADREEGLSGLRFGVHGPSINHLLYADDCLFSCRANKEESVILLRILKRYGEATGQLINPVKSSIMFGKGVSTEEKTRVKLILGICVEGGEGKYLGLPESMKGSKVKLFSYVKERMCRKVSGWYARTLSQGGKEVMIKAVASALPVSAMSVYKMPKSLISSMHGLLANFWWSSDEQRRKIHWLSWEKMCQPKENGGMGFKDLECFNQALLAKQAWRLTHDIDCLMSRVMKGKYYEDSDFMEAKLGGRPSYAWRSIIYGRDLLKHGIKRSVGNGQSIRVWSEPWLEDNDGVCRAPIRRQRQLDVNLRVADIIDHPSGRWDSRKLKDLFVPRDVRILQRHQPVLSEPDSWIWRFSRTGIYLVKTGYDLAFSKNHQELLTIQNMKPSLIPLKMEVWRFLAPPKLKVFIWKALSGAVSVSDCLEDRGMKCDKVCQTCGKDGESINHVLFDCTFARKVWACSGFSHPNQGFHDFSLFANLNYLILTWKRMSEMIDITRCFPWILWYLWKNRNLLIFEGTLFQSDQLCNKAKEEADLWYEAQDLEDTGEATRWESVVQTSVERRSPSNNMDKCEISIVWGKKKQVAGAAWVLSDSSGHVLLQSRRSFGLVESKDDAHFLGMLWAVESMISHRRLKVYFTFEGGVLVKAINRPKAWPSFKSKVVDIRGLLMNFLRWQVVFEPHTANSGVRLIAESARADRRFQSYVAIGYPSWCP